jgi:hypothetical protein
MTTHNHDHTRRAFKAQPLPAMADSFHNVESPPLPQNLSWRPIPPVTRVSTPISSLSAATLAECEAVKARLRQEDALEKAVESLKTLP